MAVKDVLEKITADVKATKAAGFDKIDIEKMLIYLDTLNAEKEYNHDIQMELLKSSNVSEIEFAKLNHAASLEAFRSVITVGTNAAKAFMIINGGAAISLLAFLGNIWNKDSSSAAISTITVSLLIFCMGVLCSGACSGFTYLAQICYASSDLRTKKVWHSAGNINNFIAILTGLSSLVLFGVGAYVTYTSMGSQFS